MTDTAHEFVRVAAAQEVNRCDRRSLATASSVLGLFTDF